MLFQIGVPFLGYPLYVCIPNFSRGDRVAGEVEDDNQVKLMIFRSIGDKITKLDA